MTKIKQLLLSVLFCFFTFSVFSVELISTVETWSNGNIVEIHYTLEDTYDHIIFENDEDARVFVYDLGRICDNLNHQNGEFEYNPNKERVEYVYSGVLIERIQYLIRNSLPRTQYPDDAPGVPDNTYNKQYYRKDVATGESCTLFVNKDIKRFLHTIMFDGVFTDELLTKYGFPIPENSGLRYELGYGLKGRPLKPKFIYKNN